MAVSFVFINSFIPKLFLTRQNANVKNLVLPQAEAKGS